MAGPTTSLTAALARARLDLDSLGRPYALVGGFAVSARAAPRLIESRGSHRGKDLQATLDRFLARLTT